MARTENVQGVVVFPSHLRADIDHAITEPTVYGIIGNKV
jgi:ribosomal protein S3